MLNHVIFSSCSELQKQLYKDDVHLAIYGVGAYAQKLFDELVALHVPLYCFIDYAHYPESKVGKEFNGLPVCSLPEAIGQTDIIILGAKAPANRKAMLKRLSADIDTDMNVVTVDADIDPLWTAQHQYYSENRGFSDHALAETQMMREIENFNWNSNVFEEIYKIVEPYTVVGRPYIYFFMIQVLHAIRRRKSGIVAEFGVRYGGASLAAALIQKELFGKILLPICMFDAFTYFPDFTDEDFFDSAITKLGPAFTTKFPAKENPICYVDDVRKIFDFYGIKKDLQGGGYDIKCGWFEDTTEDFLCEIKGAGKQISVLRLDADTYEATKFCLEKVMPAVEQDACVIVDDYHCFSGCALAVHEYLAANRLSYRLCSIGDRMHFFKTNEPIIFPAENKLFL
jgi:hypothetical protein